MSAGCFFVSAKKPIMEKMRNNLFTLTAALFIFLSPALTAQTNENGGLPRQFRGFSLGMSLDDLKAGLIEDNLFLFRGDRDVSFLPAREQSLVETTGSSFITRAFFQLRDGAVFIMSFTLNTRIIDHYSIFMQFTQNYGQPSYLDPSVSVWETETTRIALERPLTVKYIDKVIFNDILGESGLIESDQVRQRQEFINEF